MNSPTTHSPLATLGESATALADAAAQSAEQVAEQVIRSSQRVAHQSIEQSRRATDVTVEYIRHEPVKSVLLAAAVGAALMALITMASHARGARH